MDWLCWPRFDSPACFAALLGTPENGRWRIAPCDLAPERTRRQYRGDTLVLETTMETADGGGAVSLIDFMPPRDSRSDLIRIVRGLRGRVPMRMELVLRFDYGLTVPWVTRGKDADLRGVAGPHQVMLRTAVPTRGENLRTLADFEMGEGEEAVFVLTHAASHLPPPEPADARRQLAETEAFWADWMASCPHHGRWAPAVRRSLLTLKALTYRPTGGIVAAPTASLPEVLGGSRNWDYRFCWLRDSALLLTALTGAGFLEEAGCWRDWLVRAVAGSPDQVQIMYGVAGERLLTEVELPWLPGYAGSRPVRVGNAAAGQIQLDVQGEVIDALFQARQRGSGPSAPAWPLAQAIVGHLEEVWRRAGPRHLGGARRAAPLHPLQGHGLGGFRPHGPRRRDARPRRAGRAMAPRARRDPRRCLREGLRPWPRRLHPVLRLALARREPVADPADGLPAGGRPARARHGGGDRARPDGGRLGRALRHEDDG